jgi:hypothetical protein
MRDDECKDLDWPNELPLEDQVDMWAKRTEGMKCKTCIYKGIGCRREKGQDRA